MTVLEDVLEEQYGHEIDLDPIREFIVDNPIPDKSFLIGMKKTLYRRLKAKEVLPFLEYCKEKSILEEPNGVQQKINSWLTDYRRSLQPEVKTNEEVQKSNISYISKPVDFDDRFNRIENRIEQTEEGLSNQIGENATSQAEIIDFVNQYAKGELEPLKALGNVLGAINETNEKVQELYMLFTSVEGDDTLDQKEESETDKKLNTIIERLGGIETLVQPGVKKTKTIIDTVEKETIETDNLNMLSILWDKHRVFVYLMMMGLLVPVLILTIVLINIIY